MNVFVNISYSFVFNADTNIQRSVFDMSHTVKTTFNSGYIVPLDVMEVLPGDTINMRLRSLVRLWTPIVPFMDNVYPELMITGSLKWFLIVSKTPSSSGAHKNSFVPSLHLNSNCSFRIWNYPSR